MNRSGLILSTGENIHSPFSCLTTNCPPLPSLAARDSQRPTQAHLLPNPTVRRK